MLNKIKSYVINHVMVYLNSHESIKSFIKKCIYSNRFLEKMAYKIVNSTNNKQNSEREGKTCTKRAMRVYKELKRDLA